MKNRMDNGGNLIMYSDRLDWVRCDI